MPSDLSAADRFCGVASVSNIEVVLDWIAQPVHHPINIPTSDGDGGDPNTLAPRTAVVGRQTQLVVHTRRNGKGVGGVRVELRGPGLLVTRKTNSDGVARFKLKPHGIGILRVRLLQAASCSAQVGEIPVRGPFTPPLLTGWLPDHERRPHGSGARPSQRTIPSRGGS